MTNYSFEPVNSAGFIQVETMPTIICFGDNIGGFAGELGHFNLITPASVGAVKKQLKYTDIRRSVQGILEFLPLSEVVNHVQLMKTIDSEVMDNFCF